MAESVVKTCSSSRPALVVLLVLSIVITCTQSQASDTEHEPKITIPPYNHKVSYNSRVMFFCQASGHPAPSVYWMKNDRKLSDRRNRYIFSHAYTSALVIESVDQRQAGVYQCVADNGVGEPVVANATLDVYDDGEALPVGFPVVQETPERTAVVVELGFPMRIRCAITGDPSPDLIWYKSNIPLDIAGSNRIQVITGDRPGSYDIHIAETADEDNGYYECMGRNSLGTVFAQKIRVYIRVRRYAPQFTIPPEPISNIRSGESLNLTCVAVGSPMPYVRWDLEGLPLGDTTNAPIGKHVLQLKNITASANYTCTAASDLGIIMTNAEVRVQAMPTAPEHVTITSQTQRSATIEWKQASQTGPLATSEIKYLIQFRADKTEQEWSERGEDEINMATSYVLSGLRPFSFYEIRVVPYTTYGRGTPSDIKITRTDEAAPESPPYNVKAKAISIDRALVQWNEPLQPNGRITGYNVYYTLAANAGQPYDSWMLYPTTVANTLAVLTSLTKDEVYSVSVQAKNRIGTGPHSEPIQFTMIQGVINQVPAAPSNLQVTSKTSRSITLAWERPEGTEGILSYEIYINNSRTRLPNVRSVVPPQEEYILDDLFPNTIYNIKITARSTNGEGPHSRTIQVKTDEAEPSSPPLNIQAQAPKIDASTQLEITWESPSPALANGVISGYILYYVLSSPEVDDSSATIVDIVDPEQTRVLLDNLQVWKDYKVWMKAKTSVGPGPASEPVVGRTGQAVPNAVRSFTVLAINSSAVLVTWRKPAERDAQGIMRGYQLYYTQMNENNIRVGEPQVIYIDDGETTNFTVGALTARTKYGFQIRGYTIAGDGELTRPRYAETLGAVPTAPQNFRLEMFEDDPPRVRVTWQAPAETHGELSSYRLTWGKRGQEFNTYTASVSNTRYNYIADRMSKGSEYEFRIQAQNSENYGVAAVEFIRTADGVPSGSPQNITATYKSPTSAIVSWQELDPRQANGVITMYQVRYQDRDNSIDLRADNTSETSILLEDLTPGAKYFVQVVAFTSAGAGPTSYRIPYNTMLTKPPAPLAVQAQRMDDQTSIRISWQPPLISVSGYKIFYSAQEPGSVWHDVVSDQPAPNYILTGLQRIKAYTFKVQAISAGGDVGLMSDEAYVEAVLPPPSNDEVMDLNGNPQRATSTSIFLTWKPPMRLRPAMYRISYEGISRDGGPMHLGLPIAVSYDVTQQTLERLKPNYNYTISVLVKFQLENEFIGRRTIHVVTKDVSTPQLKKDVGSAIIALSREDNEYDEVYIIVAPGSESRNPKEITLQQLQAPARVRRAVTEQTDSPDGPYIAGRFEGDSTPTEFIIGDGQEYGEYTNKELNSGVEYKAFVKVIIEGTEYSSSFSKPFTSNGPVTAAIVEQEETKEQNMVPLIVGPIGGVLVIILIVIIVTVIICRKNTHKKEKAPEPTSVVMDQPPTYPNDPVELRRMQFSTPGMQNHPPIPVTQLSGHIEQLRNHDNHKFSQEYESIEPGQQFTWDNSNLEYNKPKNRYANVIAYDHSRVVLQPMEGSPGSDYINANYMDGYRKQNAYISTQGPLPETFGDFWRMVWEQRSATIVMMTKLEERARVKCDAYWPVEGTEMYGPIIVTLTDCMELATYTVRTFQIERDGWAEKREVRQFQFTAWPDHGVPDYPTPLLIFMRRVKAATPSDSGPMVVHCSAGVGRTGAFIVIDAMLERIKHEKTVDIYGHVTCLRAQRNYMVQTEDQYIFIHDALLEAVQSGNTEIPARNLYTHIQKLTQPDGTSTSMEKEFKTLSNTKTNPARFASANLAVNKFKNRLVNVLPYESNRVCLQPIRGVDGSDYINASFIDGYRFKKAYIATQGPLGETAEDFWRMMWEHNSTIVVMLTNLREMGREKCHQYWPETRSARYQYFVVDPHAEYNMPEYTLREFKVTDARDGQSRTIRLFQFNDWPEQGVPKSGMSFIQFIGQVHKTKEQFGQEGPITVHCSAGVGRTGVFISLSIILERMRYEGVVDMFQTVKMLRTQRQGMVQTEDQYAFCYQAALEHLASFDHY